MDKGTPRLAFVDGDNWESVYVDGKLFREGHRMGLRDYIDIMRALNCDPGAVAVVYLDDDDWDEVQPTGLDTADPTTLLAPAVPPTWDGLMDVLPAGTSIEWVGDDQES